MTCQRFTMLCRTITRSNEVQGGLVFLADVSNLKGSEGEGSTVPLMETALSSATS